MVTTTTFDAQDRIRSYALLAQAFGLVPQT
jgi:hypothetical protein